MFYNQGPGLDDVVGVGMQLPPHAGAAALTDRNRAIPTEARVDPARQGMPGRWDVGLVPKRGGKDRQALRSSGAWRIRLPSPP